MKVLGICLFMLLIGTPGRSQEPSPFYEDGWLVYGVYSSVSGVPISYSNTDFPPTKSVESSSSSIMLGFGYRFRGEGSRWYFDVRGDYSSGTFSDWRVKDRGIQYYMVGVDAGYLLTDEGPASLFIGFGGGGILQSQYYDASIPREDHYNEYEYLGEAEYPIYFGFGLRVALMRNILLRGESRFYILGSGSGGFAGNTYYYDPDAKSESLGSVFGIGAEIAF